MTSLQSHTLPPPLELNNGLELCRLNHDSSWMIRTRTPNTRTNRGSGSCWLIDPWLTGDEVDYCRCFSVIQQTAPSVSPSVLQDLDIQGIIITLPFSDHCHEATIEHILVEQRSKKNKKSLPIYCANASYQRLDKNKVISSFAKLIPIPSHEFLKVTNFKLRAIAPRWSDMSKTHAGVHLQIQQTTFIIAPHGLYPTKAQLDWIHSEVKRDDIDSTILLSTVKSYKLPFFLGGAVNLGLKAALQFAESVQATDFVETHSSLELHATGCVHSFARVDCPTLEQVHEAFSSHTTTTTVRLVPGPR